MLTSLSGGLLGLLDRRFVLTAWLPSLLYWGGLGSLAMTGVGWHRATIWWTRQPAEFKVVLGALALAWITFFGYLLAAQVSLFIRIGEGYWPQFPPWSWLCQWLRGRHLRRQASMRDDPEKFPLLYSDYPLRNSRVMPTRLGNILRAAEDHPLERYQINAVVVWPRLYVVIYRGNSSRQDPARLDGNSCGTGSSLRRFRHRCRGHPPAMVGRCGLPVRRCAGHLAWLPGHRAGRPPLRSADQSCLRRPPGRTARDNAPDTPAVVRC